MQILRFAPYIVLFSMMVLSTNLVSGQTYPNRPIRFVTSEPGGSANFLTRIIAEDITGPLGQAVVVDNRPSALIAEAVMNAPPDGYTIGFMGQSFWIRPLLRKERYDPMKDFSPVTITNRSPGVLVVHPSLPAKSVKELIALAKARPGELNYGTQAPGASNHLAAELFKSMAGVDIVRVVYKSGGQVQNDIMGGQIQMTFSVVSAPVLGHVKSGRLRALAVTSAQPTELAPGIPTVAATLPGYESTTMQSIMAPAKTPEAAIKRLNQEIVRTLNKTDVKAKLFDNGADVVGSSPEEVTAIMSAMITQVRKVLKEADITLK